MLAPRLRAAPERAVELMAEHFALAVLVRRHYLEPELSPAEVEGYLSAAEPFFNSIWHDPP